MPTRITFEFWGDVQVDRTLAGIEARAQEVTPAWEQVAESFLRAERRQFSSEGGYGSGGWPALSPAYAAWKQRHYPGRKILERTGALKASLTDGPDVRVIGPQRMWIGSGVDYGLFHQRADGVPRRRPIELPESLRVRWVRIVQRFIVTGQSAGEGLDP